MKDLIDVLKNSNKTISCMESCTGGMLANEITNIEGASNVFKLGLVTYSNEFKVYFGVSNKTIEEYSVYSNNVSKEMAKQVSRISSSDYSIGITGMLGNIDPNNKCDNLNVVYISIYSKEKDECYNYKIEVAGNTRKEKKEQVINFIKEKLYGICK